MNEKTESDEFEDEDEDDDDLGEAEDLDVDVDRVMRDLDQARRRGHKNGDPAWRRLERLREEKLTAELVSDFDDYDIGDEADGKSRGGKSIHR
jgi:hypothetical protein